MSRYARTRPHARAHGSARRPGKHEIQQDRRRGSREGGATAHYFRGQIVKIAKQRGYWADLREPWEWVRLQLRDGGITDLVVALHFIGNPSPGACVAAAFMEHRATREDEFLAEMIPLDTETLVLYPAEESAPQSERFESWLEQIIKTSLAVWIKYL